ncbi:MAG: hypothetical protein H7Y59_16360 [Anaerolineales bacterium]|nr:hypothetical protein [Anaerolineales bacterium]
MLQKIRTIAQPEISNKHKPRLFWLGYFQLFPIALLVGHVLFQVLFLRPYYEKVKTQLEMEAKNILAPPSAQESTYESWFTESNASITIGYVAKDLGFTEIRQHYDGILQNNGWLYYDESDTTVKYCKRDFTATIFYNGHGFYPTDYDINFESGHGRLVNVSECERLYGLGPKSLNNLISVSVFFIWSWLYGGILILTSFFNYEIYYFIQDRLVYKHKDFWNARVSGIKWILIGSVSLAAIVYTLFFFEVYA